METTNGSTQGSRKATRQGDGRLSVTLLGLSVLLAAIASFNLTARFITPQDTLYGRLPADGVAVYLHLNASRLASPAAPLLLPENVSADEISRFALATEWQELVWGTLFGWRDGRRPTEDESRSLLAAQAVRLDDQTYFIGDSRLVDFFTGADRSIARLGADIAIGRALATVRGLSPIQGFVDPAALISARGNDARKLLPGGEQYVFSLNLDLDSSYAVALPVMTAARYPAWLGFGPQPRPAGISVAAPPARPLLTLSGERAMFDPLAVMFHKVETARQATDLDRSSQLETAEDGLRYLLDRPSVLSLSSGLEDELTADFAASYPGLSPERLVAAVTSYISAALPDRTTLVLPDQDNAVEYRFDPAKYPLTDEAGIKSLTIADIDYRLFLTARPGGGSILASSPDLLSSNQEGTSKREDSRCESVSGTKLIINKAILLKLDELIRHAFFRSPLALSALNLALFVDNGDGVIISCGYY